MHTPQLDNDSVRWLCGQEEEEIDYYMLQSSQIQIYFECHSYTVGTCTILHPINNVTTLEINFVESSLD